MRTRRKSWKMFADLTEQAAQCEANLASVHPVGLPGLLQRIIELHLTAADYGSPEERASARARAGLAAGQLALVLTRPDEAPARRLPSSN